MECLCNARSGLRYVEVYWPTYIKKLGFIFGCSKVVQSVSLLHYTGVFFKDGAFIDMWVYVCQAFFAVSDTERNTVTAQE